MQVAVPVPALTTRQWGGALEAGGGSAGCSRHPSFSCCSGRCRTPLIGHRLKRSTRSQKDARTQGRGNIHTPQSLCHSENTCNPPPLLDPPPTQTDAPWILPTSHRCPMGFLSSLFRNSFLCCCVSFKNRDEGLFQGLKKSPVLRAPLAKKTTS